MEQRKIYVVGKSYDYANWMEGKLTQVMENADLVVFTGGEDVSPELYGEPNKYAFINPSRDKLEKREFEKAVKLGIPIVGICRGSQLLSALNGGTVIQDMGSGGYIHPITLQDGRVIDVTSTHHNLMNPFELPKDDYKLIGWSVGISPFHMNGYGKDLHLEKEPEIVYFPHTRSLGIQSHPEYRDYQNNPDNSEAMNFFKTLLTDLINNTI